MSISQSIFRAYDIRGTVEDHLTPDNVRVIGQAIGAECMANGSDSIVVGRDGRLSGPDLQQALTEGLMNVGMTVVDVGMVPTPLVYYAMYELEVDSCVAVTGSHNPPNYNGLKIVVAGETLSGERIQDLYQRVKIANFVTGAGRQKVEPIVERYIERIVSDIKLTRSMKLVVDCGNGVAGGVAPQLLRALGCEVEELFCEVDGNFPNHHPDPSKPENLQDLIQKVSESQADLGMAFDGDGDRLGIVDRSGSILWADRQMILYAGDVLQRNPGAEIIFDVKSSKNLPAAIEKMGGKATMCKTGHSFIKKKLKETGALLAGEMSGHVFFKERWYGFDDGIYTAARLLEILAQKDETPEVIFKALPDSINTPEINVTFPTDDEKFVFMDKLTQSAKFEGSQNIIEIDGLRVDFNDGWGLIRASNTTPVLVLRFEADSEEALSNIKDIFREQMLKIDSAIYPGF